MFVLRNCMLIPQLTEDTELINADIVIDGEKISQIVPCGMKTDGDHLELDVAGKTVMPGLIDAHTHLKSIYSFTERKHNSPPSKPCSIVLDTLIFAQFYLDNGYTTVRDCGDNIANPTIALRDHINAGKLRGPRLFCAGPTLIPTEVGNDLDKYIYAEVDGAQEVRARVRYNIQKGADYIKLYGSGSLVVAGMQADSLLMEQDEVEEAVKIAAHKNTYCAMHAHGGRACDVGARLGVRTIEHATFIEEDTLRYLEGRKDDGHGLIITLSILIDESLGIGCRKDIYDKCIAHLSRIKDYDVLVGWGSDTGLTFYRKEPYAEFKARKELLGFSNIEILKQATINTAKLIKQDSNIGSVKAGKYADLIVIDGDPVACLEAMYQKPAHVIKGGELIR